MTLEKQESAQSLSEAALLRTEESRHILAEAAISAVNAAAVNPVRAVTQVADRIVGSTAATDIAKYTKSVGMEDRPAEFGTANWVAQQIGAAAGMMAPYLVARGAVRLSINKAYGEAALSPAHILIRETSKSGVAGAAAAEATVTGASGFLYGLAFVPSSQEKATRSSGTDFALDRLKNAAFDGAAFAAIGGMSPFMSKGLDLLASKVDQFNTKALTGSARSYEPNLPLHDILPKAQDHLVAALRGPVLTGALSGVPIGMVNAEISALKNGQLLPESKDLKENIASMMLVGSALSKVNHVVDAPNRKSAQTEVSNWLALMMKYTPDEINRLPSKIAPTVDTNYARLIRATPEFASWLQKNQHELNSGKHGYVQTRLPELNKLWTELPSAARNVPIEGMPSIMQSWNKLTPAQKELPTADLLAHARVVADLSYSNHAAQKLEHNPGFVKTYDGILSRWPDRTVSNDGINLLSNWKNLPEQIKNGTDRELMVIGSSWDKLTPSQKQLSPMELLKTSTIIRDLHLNARDAALIEQSKGFVEWYGKHTDFRNPEQPKPSLFNKFDMSDLMFRNKATIKTALKNWSVLTPELKNLDLQALQPIMRSWSEFTPTQKKLSSAELTELAKLQTYLALDKTGMEKLESAPDFAPWFNMHQKEFARPEYRLVDTSKLVPTWAELPAETRKNLTLRQAFDIAERWESIKSAQHARPLNSILETVSIANELRLNWQQATTLSENPSFYGWYKDVLRPQGPFSKIGPEIQELQAIMERWSQFPMETQLLSLGSVRSISNIWPHLPPELRSRSALEIRNIADVARYLDLSTSDTVNIFQIDALRNRVRETSKERYAHVRLDLSPVKQEIQLVLDVWKKLPADKRPQFDRWLDNNLGDRNQVSPENLKELAGTIRTIARRAPQDDAISQ